VIISKLLEAHFL